MAATAICGDGLSARMSATGVRTLDDANLREEPDEGLSDCTLARCGDGIQRLDRAEGEPGYEACDDGNEDDLRLATVCDGVCGDGSLRQRAP